VESELERRGEHEWVDFSPGGNSNGVSCDFVGSIKYGTVLQLLRMGSFKEESHVEDRKQLFSFIYSFNLNPYFSENL